MPSAKFGVSGNPFNKHLLHHEQGPEDGVENRPYSGGEAIKSNCNDSTCAIRETPLSIPTPTLITTLNGVRDYSHFADMEIMAQGRETTCPRSWTHWKCGRAGAEGACTELGLGGRSEARILAAEAQGKGVESGLESD